MPGQQGQSNMEITTEVEKQALYTMLLKSANPPGGHLVPKWRRITVSATSWRHIDNNTTSFLWKTAHHASKNSQPSKRVFGAKVTSYHRRCDAITVSPSMRRHHVASTLIRRHFYVMCPLGSALDGTPKELEDNGFFLSIIVLVRL